MGSDLDPEEQIQVLRQSNWTVVVCSDTRLPPLLQNDATIAKEYCTSPESQ
jgi:hypothetical protein